MFTLTAEDSLQAGQDELTSDPAKLKSHPATGLFVPRLSEQERRARGATASLAVAERTAMTYEPPAQSAAAVLKARGSRPMAAAAADRDEAPALFADLPALGVTVAAFRDEESAESAAAAVEEYEFVPDFTLRMPEPVPHPTTRVSGETVQAEGGLPAWPEESGVGLAHGAGNTGGDVLIGVLDTGIDAGHDEFRDRAVGFRHVSFFPSHPSWPPRDVYGFDTGGHGTHVTGILNGAARGVAPDAGLYVASVIESERIGTSMTRVVYGLSWMLERFAEPENRDKPAVVNMSLGFPSDVPANISPATYEAQLRAVRYVIDDLEDANVVTLAAIGNRGEDTYGYPGAFANVLGVGAIDFDGNVAAFSGNRRPINGPIEADKPDIVGFGVGVVSSTERDYDDRSYYGAMSGTSMAAPYAAGIAALYRSADPGADAATIRQRVVSTCLPLTSAPSHRVGAGLARYVPNGLV